MKKMIFFFGLLILNNTYADIPTKEFAECSSQKGDLDKIECFDNLAKKYNLNGVQTSKEEIQDSGKWNVSIDTNPIDDSKTVTLYLVADSGKSSMLGEPVVLIIRCKSLETNVFINWRDYLGSEARVLTRIGKEKAETRSWSLSTDSQATFFPRNEVDFLKKLLAVDSFVAQVTPYSESPVTAIFNIKGLSNAITPLREACNW
tara:strand:+ start:111 stop:719 length:609 start_codon:yes stop_codon:yes gene_type:complete